MKFVRFADEQHPNGVYGLVESGEVHVLRGHLFEPPEKTGETLSESSITRYLPPVDPPNILAFGVNYRDHAGETGSKVPEQPLLFLKATSALIAHGDNIVIPQAAPQCVDYEAELVVVMGKRARNVSADEALGYVFGYACGHDVTARDCQRGDGQWARAKSFDTFAPVGPYVVTGLDPAALRVQMRLNGAVMQDQPVADMIFSVPCLISYLSQGMTLLPGTLIYTGTPSGVGVGRTPPVFLKPGDVCEVAIDGIGVLRNIVVAS